MECKSVRHETGSHDVDHENTRHCGGAKIEATNMVPIVSALKLDNRIYFSLQTTASR